MTGANQGTVLDEPGASLPAKEADRDPTRELCAPYYFYLDLDILADPGHVQSCRPSSFVMVMRWFPDGGTGWAMALPISL